MRVSACECVCVRMYNVISHMYKRRVIRTVIQTEYDKHTHMFIDTSTGTFTKCLLNMSYIYKAIGNTEILPLKKFLGV